jgi:hypothetical protein
MSAFIGSSVFSFAVEIRQFGREEIAGRLATGIVLIGRPSFKRSPLDAPLRSATLIVSGPFV